MRRGLERYIATSMTTMAVTVATTTMTMFMATTMTIAIATAMALVKEYLGEDPCVDGGTIGEPVTQKEYVHILHEKLKHLCIETMRWYFSPPLSPDVCFKAC